MVHCFSFYEIVKKKVFGRTIAEPRFEPGSLAYRVSAFSIKLFVSQTDVGEYFPNSQVSNGYRLQSNVLYSLLLSKIDYIRSSHGNISRQRIELRLDCGFLHICEKLKKCTRYDFNN